MNRWRRIIVHLGCKDRACKHNSNDVCNSCDPPEITLFRNGAYKCQSKKEKTKTVELTRKEINYLCHLLERDRYTRYFEFTCDETETVWAIMRKLENVI